MKKLGVLEKSIEARLVSYGPTRVVAPLFIWVGDRMTGTLRYNGTDEVKIGYSE